MLRSIMTILTAAQLLVSGITGPQLTLTTWFKTGEMLRFHVVAQDDTPEMQHIKLCVRDAVRACYQDNKALVDGSMQENAEVLLPVLTQAALECARTEGFPGAVRVEMGTYAFNERELATTMLPAGEYPALMVFLGDAEGHNWWGLLDPDLALWLARVPGSEGEQEGILWDHSLRALICALFGWPMKEA